MSSRITAQAPLSPHSAIEFRRAADRALVAAHDGASLEVTSGALGWQGIAVEGGRMPGWDVHDLVIDQNLIAMNAGTAPLTFERVERGRTRRVTMPPGSLWVNPAGQPITHKIPAPSRFLDVTLDAAQVERLTGHDDIVLRGAIGEPHPQMAALMAAVSAEAHQAGRHGRPLLDTLALSVATLLHHDFSATRPLREPTGPLTERQVRLVTELMRSRMAEGVSVVELASTVGYSPDHFRRCFRRATGETPHRHHIRLRLEEARRLLLATDRPVADIAAATGFADHAHLTRSLRRTLAVTPSQLRHS